MENKLRVVMNGGEIWSNNVQIIREVHSIFGKLKYYEISVDGSTRKNGGEWVNVTFFKKIKPEHLLRD